MEALVGGAVGLLVWSGQPTENNAIEVSVDNN